MYRGLLFFASYFRHSKALACESQGFVIFKNKRVLTLPSYIHSDKQKNIITMLPQYYGRKTLRTLPSLYLTIVIPFDIEESCRPSIE